MFLLEQPRSVKNGSKPKVHQNTKFATVITVVLEALFHESASFRVHPLRTTRFEQTIKIPRVLWGYRPDRETL